MTGMVSYNEVDIPSSLWIIRLLAAHEIDWLFREHVAQNPVQPAVMSRPYLKIALPHMYYDP